MTLLILAGTSAFAGGTAGNGGDSAYCQTSPSNDFRGYLSADYLLTLRQDNSDLVRLQTWAAYRDRLTSLLAKKYPALAKSWKDYVALAPGESDIPPDQILLQKRIWLDAPYGLIDLHDEQLVHKLPPNCARPRQGSDLPQLIQTVVRQKQPRAIVYNYDTQVFAELAKQPQQYSFMIVHEWLWDFFDDPEAIRRVNRFLHSSLLEKLKPDELQLALENLGLSVPVVFTPVCDRTPEVRRVIERIEARPCGEIEKLVHDYDTTIDREGPFSEAGIPALRAGDLFGVTAKILAFEKNHIKAIDEAAFAGLNGPVSFLRLEENEITEFPSAAFRYVSPHKLNLKKNQLERFSIDYPSLRLKILDLSENKLREFPRGLASGAPELGRLYLMRNSIREVPAEAVSAWLRVKDYDKLLMLDFNQITELPDGVFPFAFEGSYYNDDDNRFKNRVGVSVSNNLLSRLPKIPDGFPPIPLGTRAWIDLSNNKITENPIPWLDELCKKLHQATDVRLSGNPLSVTQSEIEQFNKRCYNVEVVFKQ